MGGFFCNSRPISPLTIIHNKKHSLACIILLPDYLQHDECVISIWIWKNVQILAQHLWMLHHVALLRFGGWVPYCKEICSKVFQCLKLKIHLRIVHNLSSLRLLSQILKGLKRGFNNLFDFQKLLNRYRIEKWIHKSFTYLRSKNFVHNDGRSNHVFSCGNINDYTFSIWGEGSSHVRSLWMIHFHHIHQTVKCWPSLAHSIVFPFSM